MFAKPIALILDTTIYDDNQHSDNPDSHEKPPWWSQHTNFEMTVLLHGVQDQAGWSGVIGKILPVILKHGLPLGWDIGICCRPGAINWAQTGRGRKRPIRE
jgi:hypothetical protein